MTVELKRMLQRRGLKSELPDPNSLRDGEIYLALDTEEMLFTSNKKYIKTVTESDIVNDLTSTNTNKPLSANMGKALDTKITNVNTYWQVYTSNMVDEINKKQEIIVHKGSVPPSDTSLIWCDTSV